jgi:hypothetical protein
MPKSQSVLCQPVGFLLSVEVPPQCRALQLRRRETERENGPLSWV